MRTKILLRIIIILIAFELYSEDKENYQVVGVNVNLRSESNTKSKVVTVLRIGEDVILLKRGPKDKIGNFEGEWYYVSTCRYNDKTKEPYFGWVFNYYLLGGNNPVKDLEKLMKIKLANNKFSLIVRPPDVDEIISTFRINEDGTYDVFVGEEIVNSGYFLKYRSYYYPIPVKMKMAVAISFYIDETNMELIPIKGVYDYYVKPTKLKIIKLPVCESFKK
jgi:hypothetical protein